MFKLKGRWENALKMAQETTQSFWQSLFQEKNEACLLCGRFHGPICQTCENDYFHPDLGRCYQCGKLVAKEQTLCRDCTEGRGPQGLDRVVAWGHYTGAWRDYIQAVKFKSQPYLLKGIGKPLADRCIRDLPAPDGLIPVPMHRERLTERGFNQAAVLASLLHWELGIPLVEALGRRTATTPQVGLSRHERLHNLTGAFAMSETGKKWSVQGKRIWLVDDVVTTGATMEACAAVLREQGAAEVYGVALAAGMEVKNA